MNKYIIIALLCTYFCTQSTPKKNSQKKSLSIFNQLFDDNQEKITITSDSTGLVIDQTDTDLLIKLSFIANKEAIETEVKNNRLTVTIPTDKKTITLTVNARDKKISFISLEESSSKEERKTNTKNQKSEHHSYSKSYSSSTQSIPPVDVNSNDLELTYNQEAHELSIRLPRLPLSQAKKLTVR